MMRMEGPSLYSTCCSVIMIKNFRQKDEFMANIWKQLAAGNKDEPVVDTFDFSKFMQMV